MYFFLVAASFTPDGSFEFIHIFACSLFILITLEYSTVWIYHNSFICSTFDGHLGRFQVGAIMGSSDMNILVHAFDELVDIFLSAYTP